MVGTIATAWSALERGIDAALWQMSGLLDRRIGACLTSQIQSVRQKLIALEALAQLKGASEQTIRAIRRFQNQTEKPSRDRNMVVHNPIMFLAKENRMVLARIPADRKLVADFHPLAPEEMQIIQQSIAHLINDFSTLMNEHIVPLLSTSQGMQPEPPAPTQDALRQEEQSSSTPPPQPQSSEW
jgi:hypothetical protein